MSKGSKRRPSNISVEMENLRWELAFKCRNSSERKEEILKRIKELERKTNGVTRT